MHAILMTLVALASAATVLLALRTGAARAAGRGGDGSISLIRTGGKRLVEVGASHDGVGGGTGGVLLGEDGKSAVMAWAGKPSWVVNGRVPLDEWGYNFPGSGSDVYEFAAERLMAPAYRFQGAPSSVLYSFYTSLQRFRTQEGARPGMKMSLAERLERGRGYRMYHFRDGSPFLVRRWGRWELTIGSEGGRVNELRVDPTIEPAL